MKRQNTRSNTHKKILTAGITMQTESPGGRTEKRAWGNDCSLLQCEQVWAEVDEATQLHKLVQLCPSAHPQPGRAKPQQEGL